MGATGAKALSDQISAANKKIEQLADVITRQRRAFLEMMGE